MRKRGDSGVKLRHLLKEKLTRAEKLMRRDGIHSINSTTKSIEEIATTILRELRISRQVY